MITTITITTISITIIVYSNDSCRLVRSAPGTDKEEGNPRKTRKPKHLMEFYMDLAITASPVIFAIIIV